ncbi:hypothetical protein, partial [Proteus faecis]|uniref:hypothetical protein n=1 Tax=Proteus faecis TaxID=2050967 RepID=UPI00301C6228
MSPTLFLLHINDMLSIDGIHCYAEDSTGDRFYTGRTNVPRTFVDESRTKLVSEMEKTLTQVAEWG